MRTADRHRAKAQVFVAAREAEPRRRPRQERARATVAAILEAAAEVIDEVGWAHASTNRIAKRAGVSIGSLYQYFPNKEAILVGLFEKHHRDVHAVVGETLVTLGNAKTPVRDVLRKLFDDLIELHDRDPVLARVLSTEVPLRIAGANERTPPGHDHEMLTELLSQGDDVDVRNLSAAARIIEITVGALTRWMVHEAPPETDLEPIVDEAVTMLSGYLQGPSASSNDASHVDYSSYPGGAFVERGLQDLNDGRESVDSLLVSIGAPRLRRLGLPVERPFPSPEHRLYRLLAEKGTDSAHARYNALIRRLVSFERAFECAG